MESFGWEDAQVDISTPCLWSSQQHEIEKRLMISNSNLCESPAGSVVAKSGSLTTWGDFYNTSPPLLMNDKPYGRNLSEGDLTAQFGVENHASLYQNGNSSLVTETSVDNDVFSMIFSDCKNLWSFHSASAVSSGESEDNGPCRPERLSLHSSDQYTINGGRVKHAEENPNPAKRSLYDQKELKTCSSASFGQVFQNGPSKTNGTGFQFISEVIPPKAKKPRSEKCPSSSNISFQLQPSSSASSSIVQEPDPEAIAQMKEMIYRAAAFRPVNLGLDAVERPKRKNVKISSDPQTVAARQRRERISERIRILQKLVPGGSKMDTASMLDEAASYLKFLRSQIKALENIGQKIQHCPNSTNIAANLAFSSLPFYHSFPMQTHLPLNNPTHIHQQ